MDNSLKSYLQESFRVDESLTLLAIGLIAFAAKPILKEFGGKAGEGVGDFFGGLANFFGIGKKAREEKERKRREKEREAREREKEDREWEKTKREWEKEDREREEKEKQEAEGKGDAEKEQAAMANILNVAEKKATKPEDKETIDLIRSSSVDKDGNPVPVDKMGDRMKEITGKDPKEVLAARGVKDLDDEEMKKYQKAVTDEVGKLTPAERQTVADDGLKKSRELSKAIQKHKEEAEKLQKDLEAAEKSGDKDKIKAAQDALKKHNDSATGLAATLARISKKDNKPAEPKKDDKPAEPKKEPKKDKGADGEPAGTTAKEEVVKDPKTGKEKKQKVFTGPKGGRYYYPEGSPHKPENKVYVESSLSEYLATVF